MAKTEAKATVDLMTSPVADTRRRMTYIKQTFVQHRPTKLEVKKLQPELVGLLDTDSQLSDQPTENKGSKKVNNCEEIIIQAQYC